MHRISLGNCLKLIQTIDMSVSLLSTLAGVFPCLTWKCQHWIWNLLHAKHALYCQATTLIKAFIFHLFLLLCSCVFSSMLSEKRSRLCKLQRVLSSTTVPLIALHCFWKAFCKNESGMHLEVEVWLHVLFSYPESQNWKFKFSELVLPGSWKLCSQRGGLAKFTRDFIWDTLCKWSQSLLLPGAL